MFGRNSKTSSYWRTNELFVGESTYIPGSLEFFVPNRIYPVLDKCFGFMIYYNLVKKESA